MIYILIKELLGYSSNVAGILNAATFFLIVFIGFRLEQRTELEVRSIILILYPIAVFLVGTVYDWAFMGGLYVLYLLISYISKRYNDTLGMVLGAVGLVALGAFLVVFDLVPPSTDECIEYGAGILSTC